ncbi:class I SAM-dependent methyltransferase [Paracoccus onubensis]|uniref:class I SAM-dependent methyltransferase n=1 Tax=Paracoccus onubensis TaxID=1675788 RepID=UPI0011C4316B|nr:class I SAM-dependent methyltransferase [Paracoccus onubensis]
MADISEEPTKIRDGWDELSDMYQEVLTAESSGRHRINQRRSVLRLVPKNGVGAEIGVFTGLFAPVLDEICKPTKLYLVDPWDKLHGTHFPDWGAYTNQVRVPTAGAKKAAELRASYMSCMAEVVTAFSGEWLKTQNKGALDWVYLDANHKFDEVLSDLRDIDAVLAENGIILGDDAWVQKTGEINGVCEALYTFCREQNYLIIHLDGHGQWAIKRTRDVIKVVPADAEPASEPETIEMSNVTGIADSTSNREAVETSDIKPAAQPAGFVARLRGLFKVFE